MNYRIRLWLSDDGCYTVEDDFAFKVQEYLDSPEVRTPWLRIGVTSYVNMNHVESVELVKNEVPILGMED